MTTRRTFLWAGTAAGAGAESHEQAQRMAPALRAGRGRVALNPASIPKFASPLFIPPAMPRAAVDATHGLPTPIGVRQFTQQILPAPLPSTDGVGDMDRLTDPATFHYPSPSFEASAPRRWSRVKWINQLVDDERQLSAAPAAGRSDAALGESAGRRDGPRHARLGSEASTADRCRWCRICTATTAAKRATAIPKRGFFPAAQLPKGYRDGRQLVRALPSRSPKVVWNVDWDPGSATFTYPEPTSAATTLWYHDHALGMTRLNSYAGPVGVLPDYAAARAIVATGALSGSRAGRWRRPRRAATTRSRWSSRIVRSTRTARCSIPTTGRSSKS